MSLHSLPNVDVRSDLFPSHNSLYDEGQKQGLHRILLNPFAPKLLGIHKLLCQLMFRPILLIPPPPHALKLTILNTSSIVGVVIDL